MRMRRLFSLLLSCLSGLLIVFSVESIDCSAALTGGRFMTAAEALETFGDSFSITYWDGSDLVTTTALYQGVTSLGDVPAVAETDFLQDGRSVLSYTFSGNISGSPEQLQIDIAPEYSIFDVDQIHTCILTPAGATYISPYQSPQWVWLIGGQRTVFEGLSSGGEMYRIPVGNQLCLYTPVDWSGNSLTSAYSVRAVFSSGNLAPTSGVYSIFLAIPYITYDSSGSNGSAATGLTTTNINVNVDVDLSETNSILDDIKDAISGIWSGITGVFVPQSAFVQQWRLDMADTLGDSFGKYSELDSTLSRVQSAFTQTSGSAVVSFPGVSPPGIGTIIPASQVSAVPQSLQSFLPHIKFAFNILATMLFVNGMKRKWDEIIHGKVVTETESGVL